MRTLHVVPRSEPRQLTPRCSPKKTHYVKTQVPVKIDFHDPVPHTDEVVSTTASHALGLVSRIIRTYPNGAMAFLDVSVGTGLVLRHLALTAREVEALPR